MPCTTILAGVKATHDGSTVIARNDDGAFEAKRVLVIPPSKQPGRYKSILSHFTMELPGNPLRYTCVPNVSKKKGLWPACGINEKNVAMTATETITSNSRVLAADPLVELKEKKGRQKEIPGGIGEEDLVYIVLPYISTAREGVLRLGKLLEEYGTYEENGIAFSDAKEVWWMETIGGHHWIARRVPDDRVVIMPNQFGLDNFDFADALGEKKEHLCSADLLEFANKNRLYLGTDDKHFNPRLAFGSRTDSDHIYNTPRAWYLGRYLADKTYRWDGENADYNPESNDIPWSFVPDQKVTVDDIRYLLGSYYQGTPYNPYDKNSPLKWKYRTIGVPNSDVCGILQIRGYLPAEIQGLEWLSLGGSGFTACFPVYANVDSMPDYLSKTTETVSTDSMYWQSRLIAALTDSHYATALLFNERYRNTVMNRGSRIIREYDEKVISGGATALLSEANQAVTAMVKEESDKALGAILANASEHMKIRYHRGDN